MCAIIYDCNDENKKLSWCWQTRATPCYTYNRVYVDLQNLVKIGWAAPEWLCIFYFQNGDRPPSWIWYDVIVDHPRLVFDGPNILLKLHVDRFNILRDTTIFIFGPFGLKLPIHAHFWRVLGDMTGTPWNWVPAQWVKKTRVLGLPDGRKSFKIGLAV